MSARTEPSARARPPARLVLHVATSWLFVLVIGVQVFLAGAAMTNLGGSGDFALHITFGHTAVGLAALAVVVTAVIGGMPRRDTAIAFGLLLLYFVQSALPSLRELVPMLAGLHALIALLLFGAAVWYARRTSVGAPA